MKHILLNNNHHNKMETNGYLFGAVCGVIGGMTKFLFFLQIDAEFGSKLIQAGITALLCGMLGALGKWGFDFIKDKLRKRKKNY